MQAALRIILPTLLLLSSTFLILLVLVQRGRGGGLAGAFGGLGGQSAFGTKAGDLFTRITIIVATFWIILCAASVKLLNESGTSLISPTLGATAPPQPGGAAKGAKTESPAADAGTAAKTKSSAPAKGAAPESGK
ncbi:MAG: preprotein translocase subunit SecG [Pirellulales bacterium]